MKNGKKISGIITTRLLLVVFAAFIISSLLTFFLLKRIAEKNACKLVQQNCLDLSLDIFQKANEYFIQYYNLVYTYLELGDEGMSDYFRENGSRYTYVTDCDGVIVSSGADEFLGRNIREIPGMGEYLDVFANLPGKVDETQASIAYTDEPLSTLDNMKKVQYIIFQIPDKKGFVILATDIETLEYQMLYAGQFAADNRHIGQEGFNILVTPEKKIINSPSPKIEALSLIPRDELIDELDRSIKGEESNLVKTVHLSSITHGYEEDHDLPMIYGKGTFWETDYFYALTKYRSSYYIYSFYPVHEAMESVNTTIWFMFLIETVVFSVLFFAMNFLINLTVVEKIRSVNLSLDRISQGDLSEKVEVRDSREFNALSDDINSTVDKLKDYIAQAAARIDEDLAVAKDIQNSALPSIFPPFPDRKEFELFASMRAAKEVGGDFYDFFMPGENILSFLIADVSGKSIPGAMFMMTSKTIIKSLSESGLSPAETFTSANEKLCEGNEAEMFVTAWLGYLDLKTGIVHVANAGHNPPLLIHDGKAEYVVLKPGLILAGMEGVKYKEQQVELQKGDILFLYTDGVTEAMNSEEKLYGEERLQKLLSFGSNLPQPVGEGGITEAICSMVSKDIDLYTEGTEQSDDITMLCIRYLGA